VITAVLWMAGACPALQPVPGGPGDPAVPAPVAAQAQALNAEGKRLYRDGQWAAARERYGAALAADPAFGAPALNRACALAREERFDEAAREAAALIRRASVPWSREVVEAFDLAALHDRPEMALIRTAIAEGGQAWGQALAGSLLFVARTRPPVRLAGQGVLVLALGQELHAFDPATGRYRQVTADDGRVLAFDRSGDGRAVVYLRGDKLVREGAPALRGLTVRRLDLTTMALTPPVLLPGDVSAVELDGVRRAQAFLRVTTSDGVTREYRYGEALVEGPVPAAPGGVRLTAAGVAPTTRSTTIAGCALRARDQAEGDLPTVRLTGKAGSVRLAARFGAGLAGLPFP
jgi:hypothetical protein